MGIYLYFIRKGLYSREKLDIHTLCGCILCEMIFMNISVGSEVKIINNLLKGIRFLVNSDLIYCGVSLIEKNKNVILQSFCELCCGLIIVHRTL